MASSTTFLSGIFLAPRRPKSEHMMHLACAQNPRVNAALGHSSHHRAVCKIRAVCRPAGAMRLL